MRLRCRRSLLLSIGRAPCGARGPTVELKGQRFDIEIAADDAARARGLMFRDSMPADHGMLFLSTTSKATFWMKNTPHPAGHFIL